MARAEIGETVASRSGRPIAGATVQVNKRSGSTATVYASETGTTTLTNPLTTDAYGRIEGWLAEGSFDLVVTANGQSYTQRFEALKGTAASGGVFSVTDAAYGATYGLTVSDIAANTTALTSAVAAAAAAKGRVFVPAGTLRITNPLTFTATNNIEIVGEGAGISIIEYDVNNTDGVLFSGCTGVTLRNLTFRHKAAQTVRTTSQNVRFYQCTDAVAQDCEVAYSKSLGLTFEQTTNVRCERNYVHDTLADGIHVNTPRGTIMISGNRVETTNDDMIAVWNFTALLSAAGTYSVQIIGNKCKTARPGTGVATGIRVGGVEDFVIQGNTVRDTDSAGISVVKTLVVGIVTGACRNGVISGNVLVGNNASANASYSPVGALEVLNLDAAAAAVDTPAHENITIVGNTIDSAGNMGIEVEGTRGIAVTGNTVINANRLAIGLPYSIQVRGSTGGTVTGNTVSYTSGTTIWMVHAFVCTDMKITGNHGTGFSTPFYAAALVDGATTRVFVDAMGTGTPEGSVTNPVGSVWHRTDGGAATSIYIKESGTGAAGWVAK